MEKTFEVNDLLLSCDASKIACFLHDEPLWRKTNAFGDALRELATAKPHLTDLWVTTLAEVRQAIGERRVEYYYSKTKTIAGTLARSIQEMLQSFFGDRPPPTIDPQNEFLIASLVSGSVMWKGLCFSPEQFGEIAEGLQFPSEWRHNPDYVDQYEVYALGSCIQLLVAGRSAFSTEELDEVQVIQKLQEVGYCVHDPRAKKILEMTKEQSTSGFNTRFSTEEIWSILFGGDQEANSNSTISFNNVTV